MGSNLTNCPSESRNTNNLLLLNMTKVEIVHYNKRNTYSAFQDVQLIVIVMNSH